MLVVDWDQLGLPTEEERRFAKSPRDSFQLVCKLTERAREELAALIKESHPEWTAEEVRLERNRRWLRRSFEGEVFGAASEVLYNLLCYSEEPDACLLEQASRVVKSNPELLEPHFVRGVQQLGLEREWQSILDKLGIE